MNISSLEVVALVNPRSLNDPKDTLHLTVGGNDSLIVADSSQDNNVHGKQTRYTFTRCLHASTPVSECRIQAAELVNLALDGFNAAAVFMSVGVEDPFEHRMEMMESIVLCLKTELEKANRNREERQINTIKLDYAYLGITDDYCYDISNSQRYEKSYVLEDGLDHMLIRIQDTDEMWNEVKKGSKFPFVVKLRLTDDESFMGNIVLADLMQPNFLGTVNQISPRYSFHYSFSKLKDLVSVVVDPEYDGYMDIDKNLFTKLLSEYFCGKSKCITFMYFDERSKKVEEVTEALSFSKSLQKIRLHAMRNQKDIRVEDFKYLYELEQGKLAQKEKAQLDLNEELLASREDLSEMEDQCKEWKNKCKLLEKKLNWVKQDLELKIKQENVTRLDFNAAVAIQEGFQRKSLVELVATRYMLEKNTDLAKKKTEKLKKERIKSKELEHIITQLNKARKKLTVKKETLEQANTELDTNVKVLQEEVNSLKTELQICNEQCERSLEYRKRDAKLHQAELSFAQEQAQQYLSQIRYYLAQTPQAPIPAQPTPAAPVLLNTQAVSVSQNTFKPTPTRTSAYKSSPTPAFTSTPTPISRSTYIPTKSTTAPSKQHVPFRLSESPSPILGPVEIPAPSRPVASKRSTKGKEKMTESIGPTATTSNIGQGMQSSSRTTQKSSLPSSKSITATKQSAKGKERATEEVTSTTTTTRTEAAAAAKAKAAAEKEKAEKAAAAIVIDKETQDDDLILLEKEKSLSPLRSPILGGKAFESDEENEFPMFDEPNVRKSFIKPLPAKKPQPSKKAKPVKNTKKTSDDEPVVKKKRKLTQRPTHHDISTRGSVSPMTKWLKDN